MQPQAQVFAIFSFAQFNKDNWLSLLISYGQQIIHALIVIILGWMLSNWARRQTTKYLRRFQRIDNTLKPLLAELVRYGILLLAIIAVLAEFGVQTASIITILGGATLAIGLALQGTLTNIASGIMLLFLRPFNVGDYIDADGIAGTVDEIGLFTTRMTTFEGVYQEVPNANLWNRVIKNYSRSQQRRIDLVVGIGYDDNLDQAKDILIHLLQQESRLLQEPAPEVLVTELGDSAIHLTLRAWVIPDDYFAVLFALTEQAKKRLTAAGISIPFPQREVRVIAGSALS
ncbi:mechanosensitive ion channel domain-containing protein [Synechocystis sp. LKSZ1]|uniref:mechanosensitive ion channel family protein n=1 Tax=Synechocystis sp. LKSZ1 TaxID=3144951 RepID=UPI00336C229F